MDAHWEQGESQLLHLVFVLLQFSVHHFESSEEVPEEEQQECESQHKNLKEERKQHLSACNITTWIVFSTAGLYRTQNRLCVALS